MTSYVRDERVLWQRTSRRVLIDVGDGGRGIELRDVAMLLWDALAEPVELDDLVDDFVDAFAEPRERVRADLTGSLSALEDARAVRRC